MKLTMGSLVISSLIVFASVVTAEATHIRQNARRMKRLEDKTNHESANLQPANINNLIENEKVFSTELQQHRIAKSSKSYYGYASKSSKGQYYAPPKGNYPDPMHFPYSYSPPEYSYPVYSYYDNTKSSSKGSKGSKSSNDYYDYSSKSAKSSKGYYYEQPAYYRPSFSSKSGKGKKGSIETIRPLPPEINYPYARPPYNPPIAPLYGKVSYRPPVYHGHGVPPFRGAGYPLFWPHHPPRPPLIYPPRPPFYPPHPPLIYPPRPPFYPHPKCGWYYGRWYCYDDSSTPSPTPSPFPDDSEGVIIDYQYELFGSDLSAENLNTIIVQVEEAIRQNIVGSGVGGNKLVTIDSRPKDHYAGSCGGDCHNVEGALTAIISIGNGSKGKVITSIREAIKDIIDNLEIEGVDHALYTGPSVGTEDVVIDYQYALFGSDLSSDDLDALIAHVEEVLIQNIGPGGVGGDRLVAIDSRPKDHYAGPCGGDCHQVNGALTATISDAGGLKGEVITSIREAIKDIIDNLEIEGVDHAKYLVPAKPSPSPTRKPTQYPTSSPTKNTVFSCSSYPSNTNVATEDVEIDYQYQLIGLGLTQDDLDVIISKAEEELNNYIIGSGILACFPGSNRYRSLASPMVEDIESRSHDGGNILERQLGHANGRRRLDLVAIDSRPPDKYVGSCGSHCHAVEGAMTATISSNGMPKKEVIRRIREAIREFLNSMADNPVMIDESTKDAMEKVDDSKYAGPQITIIACPPYNNDVNIVIDDVEIDYQYHLITLADDVKPLIANIEEALNEYIGISGILTCGSTYGYRSLGKLLAPKKAIHVDAADRMMRRNLNSNDGHRRLELVAIDSKPADEFFGSCGVHCHGVDGAITATISNEGRSKEEVIKLLRATIVSFFDSLKMDGVIDAVYIGPPIGEDDRGNAIPPPSKVIEFRSVNGLTTAEKLSIAAGAFFYVILLLVCFAWYKKRFSSKEELEESEVEFMAKSDKDEEIDTVDQSGSITEDDSIDTYDSPMKHHGILGISTDMSGVDLQRYETIVDVHKCSSAYCTVCANSSGQVDFVPSKKFYDDLPSIKFNTRYRTPPIKEDEVFNDDDDDEEGSMSI